MLSDLEQLETQYQRPGNPASPLVQRLEALEQHLVGGPRQGSMVQRIQYLRSRPNSANGNFQGPPPRTDGYFPPSSGGNYPGTMPGAFSSPNQNYPTAFPPANMQNQPANAYPASNNNFPANNVQFNNQQNSFAQPNYPPQNGNFISPNNYPPSNQNSYSPPNQNNYQPQNQNSYPPPNQSSYPQPNGIPSQDNNSGAQIPNSTPSISSITPNGPLPSKQSNAQQADNANRTNKDVQQQTAPPAANYPVRPLVAPQPEAATFNPLQVAGANAANKFGSDALPLLNAFPPSIVRVEPDKSGLIARPDYYREVSKASKGKVIRFKSMPIPVYIQNYSDRGFMNCVLRAFENWEGRSNGTVRFTQTDNPNQARIQVVWKHLGTKSDSGGCILGAHTILKYTSHGNGSLSLMSVGAVPVPIYIPRLGPKYTVPPQVMEVNLDLIMSKEPSIRYQCLQGIVTHELGHALGLLGHSPNLADIMYPITDEHSRISERDLNTIQKLYSEKMDVPL